MTIDEAVEHCYQVVEERESKGLCAAEHKQLVLWLTELKARRSFFRCYVEACENNTGGGCRRDYVEIEECGICGRCGEAVPLCKQYEADVPDMDGGNMECGDCKAAKEVIFREFEGWPTEEEVAQMKRRIDGLPPVILTVPKKEMVKDCISKDKAIVQLSLLSNWDDEWNVAIRKCIETVKSLPPVTPVRKKGHWREVYAETDYRNGWIEFSCEACEHQHGLESGEYGWSYGEPIPWKFCPICGAEMDGAESEVTRNED